MTGHHETITEKKQTVNDLDHTVVTIRPKFYIGSSGSVWRSDFMLLRREFPQLLKFLMAPTNIAVFYFDGFVPMFLTVCFTLKTTQLLGM